MSDSANKKFVGHFAAMTQAYEGCSLTTILDAGLHEAQYTLQELESEKLTLEVQLDKLKFQIWDVEKVVASYESMLESAKGIEDLQDKLREQIKNG